MLFINHNSSTFKKNHPRIWFRRHWISLVWAVLFTSGFLVLVLGVIGFHKNLAITDKDNDYHISTLLFMTIQLFFMNSGAQPEPINWELETARWLSVVVSSSTVLQAFLIAFRRQVQEQLCRFKSNHHVLCGFGAVGRNLFQDLANKGEHVIVIDKNFYKEDITAIDHSGGYYLERDCMNPETFAGTGLAKAKSVIISCGSDLTNIQIAEVIFQRQKKKSKNHQDARKCQIFIECEDHRILSVLELDGKIKDYVELHRFSSIFNGARVLVEENPFDYLPIREDSQASANLVLLNMSAESEALIIHLARLGHYANMLKPIVSVFMPNAKCWKEKFVFKYPELEKVVEIETFEMAIDSVAARCEIFKKAYDINLLLTLVLSSTNEGELASLSVTLNGFFPMKKIPIFVNFKNNRIICAILSKNENSNLLPLSIIEKGCNTHFVFNDQLDHLAKIIHQDYIDASMRLGFDSNQKPAMKPWDMLEPSYKQSNRDQADHISVKIRSINCKIVPLKDANNNIEFAFSPKELEMLGKMEHSRWCANRRLEGYVYGLENDLIKKTSPYLVAWEELDEDIKSYDKNAVKIIPKILNEAGYCIQRICSI